MKMKVSETKSKWKDGSPDDVMPASVCLVRGVPAELMIVFLVLP